MNVNSDNNEIEEFASEDFTSEEADTVVHEEQENSEDKSEEKRNLFGEGIEWTGSLVYAVLAMILLNIFVFRTVTVDGPSMNNTLQDKDRVISTNFFYTPQRGDIVVVQADAIPNNNGTYGEPIIKRVIGIEGDVIRFDFDNGIVYRNGEALNEDYIKDLTYYNRYLDAVSDTDYVVPKGHVYVMGDNRNNSLDSRDNSVGMVDTDLIMGKAFVRIYPLSEMGLL